jgi:hypothetical protein
MLPWFTPATETLSLNKLLSPKHLCVNPELCKFHCHPLKIDFMKAFAMDSISKQENIIKTVMNKPQLHHLHSLNNNTDRNTKQQHEEIPRCLLDPLEVGALDCCVASAAAGEQESLLSLSLSHERIFSSSTWPCVRMYYVRVCACVRTIYINPSLDDARHKKTDPSQS